MTRKWVAIVVTMAAMTLGACSRPGSGCTKDTDCKGDRICEAGRCVSPPAAGGRVTKSSAGSTSSATSMVTIGPPSAPQQPSPQPLPQLPPTTQGRPSDPLGKLLQQQIGTMFQMLGPLSTTIGSKRYAINVTGIGPNGEVMAEICVNGKCEKVNLSSPQGLQKLMDKFSQGVQDPVMQGYLEMLRQFMAQAQSLTQQPPSLPQGGSQVPPAQTGPVPPAPPPGPVTTLPSRPAQMGPSKEYSSWSEIQKDGGRARGAVARIGGLKVRNVSFALVELTDPQGHIYQLVVPADKKTLLPRLAKAFGPVEVTFTITLVDSKVIRGRLEDVKF